MGTLVIRLVQPTERLLLLSKAGVNEGNAIWVRNPAEHPDGNVSVGFGLKTASGNNGVVDDFFLANGSTIRSPVDQSIQLGDGGLGIILQAQAFRKLFNRTSGYVSLYLILIGYSFRF